MKKCKFIVTGSNLVEWTFDLVGQVFKHGEQFVQDLHVVAQPHDHRHVAYRFEQRLVELVVHPLLHVQLVQVKQVARPCRSLHVCVRHRPLVSPRFFQLLFFLNETTPALQVRVAEVALDQQLVLVILVRLFHAVVILNYLCMLCFQVLSLPVF